MNRTILCPMTAFGDLGAAIAMSAALRADRCNVARSSIFSLGCVQSMRCQTDAWPTGVTTQSLARQRGLVVPEKAELAVRFQKATLDAFHDVVVAAGLNSPDEFTPDDLRQRINAVEMRSIDEIYPFVQPGELLEGATDPRLAGWRNAADAASFARRM